ncbi:leucine-rich repeat protein [Vibrio lentus]|uniref:leucine-rich repeat protein n=1 Tax=Vibrio lentus TaxID=136468 RepID=UPI000C85001E|nr:leucine-rich repeat protein [Vibrio lentus]PMI89314.1 hypothetical protein BCU35_05870 [Vibrio lentus]
MTLSKPNSNGQTNPDDFVYAKLPDGTEDASTIIQYKGKSKNVIIPDLVTTIGKRAFYENELTSVIIPDSVTTVEGEAFDNSVKIKRN